jgi:hypothetical protein
MATIFSPPEELREPNFGSVTYNEDCRAYLEDLKKWCTRNGKSKYRGKLIREPVADGYAEYMILSITPLQLIHIPLYDGWSFRWAKNWKKEDILDMLQREELLSEFFEKGEK